MTSSSNPAPTSKTPDLESALTTSGSGGGPGGWLAKLPGFEQADLNALVGRQRLSQALDLEQKPDNRYLRLSLYLLGGAAFLFVPLAAITPITQVVQASGQVVPKGSVNVIQHLEGGIVAKVNVLDGEQVEKGQVLLELNPQLVGSAYDAAEQELENLVIQQKQLQAAIEGKSELDVADASTLNARVGQSQQQLLASRLTNTADQIAASEASVQEKQAEVTGLNEQITLQREEVAMWGALTDSGAASQLQMITAEGKLAEMVGARNEARKALSQAQANLRGLKSGMTFENNSKIAELVGEEAVITENIKKIRDQLERTKIVAPVDGVVSDLRYKAPGAVIAPGAVVLQVVPNQSTKIVELRVPSKDIGFVNIGQDVDVNLLPFDSSIYGTVPGKLTNIAGTTVQDPDTGAYYYAARVGLDQQYLDPGRKQLPIQAGMPLVGDIKGERRNLLQYIIQPFTRTLGSAFRESN